MMHKSKGFFLLNYENQLYVYNNSNLFTIVKSKHYIYKIHFIVKKKKKEKKKKVRLRNNKLFSSSSLYNKTIKKEQTV